MAKKRVSLKKRSDNIVSFDFGERTYQLDLLHKKVYARFVEIETSKASEILSSWRATHATA